MENIIKFQKSLKIKFRNESLLIKALTHKSFSQKDNNEKLEFLGDRVIGLVLSRKLFDLYPNENEGVLDKRFARLVNRKTCCNVAWSIGVQNYIIIADRKKKITKKDEKILSDCTCLLHRSEFKAMRKPTSAFGVCWVSRLGAKFKFHFFVVYMR